MSQADISPFELKTMRTSHHTRICADNVSPLKYLYSKVRKKSITILFDYLQSYEKRNK